MSSVLEFNGVEVNFGDSDNIDTGLKILDENTNDGFNILTPSNESSVINLMEIEGTENKPGDDNVFTGELNDTVFGGSGDDVIYGGSGDDFLDGGKGSDIIRGDDGNDVIIGGKGADKLIGGEGQDIFKIQLEDFANGEKDRIMDFEVGIDIIEINGVDTTKIKLDGKEVKYNDETILRLSGDITGIEAEAADNDTFELF